MTSPVLTAANDIRRNQAAARDLQVARQALELNAAGKWPRHWPAQWAELAAVRIASPHANWRELAAAMRHDGTRDGRNRNMTKDKAAAAFRRLRRAMETGR